MLTPISPADPLAPTDAEVAIWIEDNYTNNDLRLPNGALLYYIGTGTSASPDFIWEVIDDISDETGVDWQDRILKRIKNGTFVAADYVGTNGDQDIYGIKAFQDELVTVGSCSTTLGGDVTFNDILICTSLPVHPNEAGAVIGGLSTGQIYQTATGELRIKL